MAVQGRMGLPLHIDHVRVWQASTLVEGQLFAIVTPLPDGGFDAQVVNANGNRYVQLSGYRTVALPVALDAKALNTLQTFVSPETVAA